MTRAQSGIESLIGLEKQCSQVADIIDPLIAETPVTSFTATRIFNDGIVADLSNDFAWTRECYKNISLLNIPSCEEFMDGRYLWVNERKDRPFLNPAYYQLSQAYVNIDSAMTVIRKHENYVDGFTFASDSTNMNLLNYFVEASGEVDRIIDEFQLTASSLRYGIDPAATYAESTAGGEISHGFMKVWFERANCILSDYLGERISLTPREYQIFSYAIRGQSAKQIAQALNISYRTVENLIQVGKVKLNCRRICEVVLLFVRAKLIERVIDLTEHGDV